MMYQLSHEVEGINVAFHILRWSITADTADREDLEASLLEVRDQPGIDNGALPGPRLCIEKDQTLGDHQRKQITRLTVPPEEEMALFLLKGARTDIGILSRSVHA
jgi:hypothetical protein